MMAIASINLGVLVPSYKCSSVTIMEGQGDGEPAATSIISLGSDNIVLLRSVYMDLLQALSFINSHESCYPQQADLIMARVSALCGSYMPLRTIAQGASFADLCYKLSPIESRVRIAHFTALAILVDDLAGRLKGESRERYLEDLTLFQLKFCDPLGYSTMSPGRGELHQGLEDLMVFLKSNQSPFFPWSLRLHSMLVKSVIDYMEANLVEQHYEEQPLSYTSHMPLFPKFLRHKSGMAEGYSYFNFIMNASGSSPHESKCNAPDERRFFHNIVYPMIPDLVEFMEYINDILFSYKELCAGDTTMWTVDHAKVHGLTPLQVLRESVQCVIDVKNRLTAFVNEAGCAELQQKTAQFLQGFELAYRKQTVSTGRSSEWKV